MNTMPRAMLAARSYSAVIGPLLACLTPDIIPEDSRRKLLIFCLEYVELFFSIARSPTFQYGGIDGVSRELTRIAGTLSEAVRTAFAGQMFKNKRGGRRAAGGGAATSGAASRRQVGERWTAKWRAEARQERRGDVWRRARRRAAW